MDDFRSDARGFGQCPASAILAVIHQHIVKIEQQQLRKRHSYAISAKVSRAACKVSSISASPCAEDRNAASKADGAKCLVPWLPGGRDVIVTASESGAAQAFVVPRDAAGLTAKLDATMGVSALPLADLAFAGVRVPASAKLARRAREVFIEPGPDKGPAPPESTTVGSANAFSTQVRGHVVTAIGEVPAATVRDIATSLAPATDGPEPADRDVSP